VSASPERVEAWHAVFDKWPRGNTLLLDLSLGLKWPAPKRRFAGTIKPGMSEYDFCRFRRLSDLSNEK